MSTTIHSYATDCRSLQTPPLSGPALPELLDEGYAFSSGLGRQLDALCGQEPLPVKARWQVRLWPDVLMDEESRILMGFQWGGWWFVNPMLPFGWKILPYIYQSLGMVAMQEIRNQGFPCSQYIDNRHLGQLTKCRPRSQALLWSATQPRYETSIPSD